MKMKVQEYLEANGLAKLCAEFHITAREYPDRVVLNYDQIESPRFIPIVNECRALILEKGTWRVLSRTFDRFYNVTEDPNTALFPLNGARIEEKIDGSIIGVYWDAANNKWQPASRSCAFAEGTNTYGNTFESIFYKACENNNVLKYLDSMPIMKEFSWTFELVSPVTRVVVPYPDYEVYLIGGRDLASGGEIKGEALDQCAKSMNVKRPKSVFCKTLQELQDTANALPAMAEGFVIVHECEGSFWRMKCKNSKYLAIANLRMNGQISGRRVLHLIMQNDFEEYMSYFPEDKKYFEFVGYIWNSALCNIQNVWSETKDLPTQKDFALAIMPRCKYDFEKGVLFELRKGSDFATVQRKMDAKKIAKSLGLKQLMAKEFGIKEEEDENG